MKTIVLVILLVGLASTERHQEQNQESYMGIDLGFSQICVGLIENGHVKTIPNRFGSRATPSLVSQINDQILIGEEVQNHFSLNPLEIILKSNCLQSLNCRKSSSFECECTKSEQKQLMKLFNSMGDIKNTNPQKLTALLLTNMKQIAQNYSRNKINKVAITIPKSLRGFRERLIYSAAALSEFTDVYINYKPNVAYLPYDAFSQGSKFSMVLELQQNYFIASIIDVDNKELQIIEQNHEYIDDTYSQSQNTNRPHNISQKIRRVINQSLNSAQLAYQDIDQVIIIGKQQKIPPSLKKIMRQLFSRAELKERQNISFDEKTCYATAHLGRRLQKQWDIVNSLLTYQMNFISVGIQTVGGIFSKILSKTQLLPYEISKKYTTYEDNVENITIKIFEGERLLTKHSHLIGALDLQIPPSPKGLPQIEVKIKLDNQYVLTVTAIEKRSGRNKTIKFSQNEQISMMQIQQIEKEAAENFLVDSIARRQIFTKQFIQSQKVKQQSTLISLHQENLQECVRSPYRSDHFQAYTQSIQRQRKIVCSSFQRYDQQSSSL